MDTLLLVIPLIVIVGLAIALFVVKTRANRERTLDERLSSLEENFLSTVRSLHFFEQGGRELAVARLTSRPTRILDEVADGEIQMRLLPSSAGLASTIASMAGVQGSKLLRHAHQHTVDIFVAEGRVTIDTTRETRTLKKGESFNLSPRIQKTINFDKNSVLIWTFTPALEEEQDGKLL